MHIDQVKLKLFLKSFYTTTYFIIILDNKGNCCRKAITFSETPSGFLLPLTVNKWEVERPRESPMITPLLNCYYNIPFKCIFEYIGFVTRPLLTTGKALREIEIYHRISCFFFFCLFRMTLHKSLPISCIF